MFRIIYILLFGLVSVYGYPKTIPVGIILKKGDELPATIVGYAIWDQQRISSYNRPSFVVELSKEIIEEESSVEIDRAVCKLLKQGIVALLTSTTPSSYPILSSYSNAFQIPLVSPDLPEVSSDIQPAYAVGIQPRTTRAVLDILRHYKWKEIVYLYDKDYGPEKLHRIFLLGYRVLLLRVVGIARVRIAEDANEYLRHLDALKTEGVFHVILDTEPSLAADIIVRHAHDAKVRKKNFHFLLTHLVAEDFWTVQAAEFGILNVTAFLDIPIGNHRVKNFKEEWHKMLPNVWEESGTKNLNHSAFYYYDAAMVLLQALEKISSFSYSRTPQNGIEARDCLQYPPVPLANGVPLAQYLKQTNMKDGLTGDISFNSIYGHRTNYSLQVVESTSQGYNVLGTWSDKKGLMLDNMYGDKLPTPARRDDKRIRITTVLSDPFMMINDDNNTKLTGNNRFRGFCKDLIDILAKEHDVEYELKVANDGTYGIYSNETGKWTGMVGELIAGKADIAVADLHITAPRQRVVDFSDPYELVSISLVMADPRTVRSTSSAFFFFSAFKPSLWICLAIVIVLFSLVFHFISKMSGAPDSIESATGAWGIWGRKITVISSMWFTMGSMLMQGTGIYPRSLASRILGAIWWVFTLVIICLYIASLTAQMRIDSTDSRISPQLLQLKQLSMESIISESLARGWPKIGVVSSSGIQNFVAKSALPMFKHYAHYLEQHPEVITSTREEGLELVRKSNGGYMLMLESMRSEYAIRQEPCDLVTTHDTANYIGYGIAFPLGSALKKPVSEALKAAQMRGVIGHLYKKWWLDSSQCRTNKIPYKGITLHSMSGLFYLLLIGFLIILLAFGIQYVYKDHRQANVRRKLSFEDLNLGHTLPLPPPELLSEPPTVFDLPEIDKRTQL